MLKILIALCLSNVAILMLLSCKDQNLNSRTKNRPLGEGEGIEGYISRVEGIVDPDAGGDIELPPADVRFSGASVSQSLNVQLRRLDIADIDLLDIDANNVVGLSTRIDVASDATRALVERSEFKSPYIFRQAIERADSISGLIVALIIESAGGEKSYYYLPTSLVSIEDGDLVNDSSDLVDPVTVSVGLFEPTATVVMLKATTSLPENFLNVLTTDETKTYYALPSGSSASGTSSDGESASSGTSSGGESTSSGNVQEYVPPTLHLMLQALSYVPTADFGTYYTKYDSGTWGGMAEPIVTSTTEKLIGSELDSLGRPHIVLVNNTPVTTLRYLDQYWRTEVIGNYGGDPFFGGLDQNGKPVILWGFTEINYSGGAYVESPVRIYGHSELTTNGLFSQFKIAKSGERYVSWGGYEAMWFTPVPSTGWPTSPVNSTDLTNPDCVASADNKVTGMQIDAESKVHMVYMCRNQDSKARIYHLSNESGSWRSDYVGTMNAAGGTVNVFGTDNVARTLPRLFVSADGMSTIAWVDGTEAFENASFSAYLKSTKIRVATKAKSSQTFEVRDFLTPTTISDRWIPAMDLAVDQSGRFHIVYTLITWHSSPVVLRQSVRYLTDADAENPDKVITDFGERIGGYPTLTTTVGNVVHLRIQ